MSGASATTRPEGLPSDWPNVEHSRLLHCGAHRWHVQQMGEGPDVVLIHGAGASTHSWAGLAPHLAPRWRVTAFDLPGQGFTRAGTRARMGLPDMAQDIAGLLAELPVRPRLIVGHSAGAALALALSLKSGTRPAGVVCLNGALENFRGLAGVLFPAMARLMAINPLTGLFLSSGVSDGAVERLLASTGSSLPPEGIARYRRLISDRRHVEGTLAMMAAWSLTGLHRELPRIPVPVRFLHGANDLAVSPEVARRAARLIPEARVSVLDGVGHLVQEEAPGRTARDIEAFAATLTP